MRARRAAAASVVPSIGPAVSAPPFAGGSRRWSRVEVRMKPRFPAGGPERDPASVGMRGAGGFRTVRHGGSVIGGERRLVCVAASVAGAAGRTESSARFGAAHETGSPEGAHACVAAPRAASSRLDQVGRKPRKSSIPARVRPALARLRHRFQSEVRPSGPFSSADLLALQLSFGNAAIELGYDQVLSVSRRQPRRKDGFLILETPWVAPA